MAPDGYVVCKNGRCGLVRSSFEVGQREVRVLLDHAQIPVSENLSQGVQIDRSRLSCDGSKAGKFALLVPAELAQRERC